MPLQQSILVLLSRQYLSVTDEIVIIENSSVSFLPLVDSSSTLHIGFDVHINNCNAYEGESPHCMPDIPTMILTDSKEGKNNEKAEQCRDIESHLQPFL